MRPTLVRPRGRAQLIRALAPIEFSQPSLSVSRRASAALPIGSRILLRECRLQTVSSKRYYSRDPLQAEHEANTVRGSRAARLQSEERARQERDGKHKEEGGSYKRKYAATLTNPSATRNESTHPSPSMQLLHFDSTSQKSCQDHGPAHLSNGIRFPSCSEL